MNNSQQVSRTNYIMQRSFQPVMTTIILTATMLLAGVPASAGTIIHSDNGTYNYPPLNAAGDSVEVSNSTTVNVFEGGEIAFTTGGMFDDLRSYDDSVVNIFGGDVGTINASGSSTVNIFGGNRLYLTSASSNSTMNITGGTFHNNVWSSTNSVVNITGGVFYDALNSYQDSRMNVSGGVIGGKLDTNHDSIITVFGTGFNFAYGDYQISDILNGANLTGFLADGTAINSLVVIEETSMVTLAAPAIIPEPATGLLSLLGLARCILSRSRRRSCLRQ
jgi:hypothetical protein